MADPGSEFRPKERRETKSFVPPPWEREQFEELARQRAEQEAEQARAEAEEAEARAAMEAQAAAVAAATPGTQAAGEMAAAVSGAMPAPQVEPALADVTPPSREGGPDEAQLAEMLSGLASEEPSATAGVWKMNVAIGGVIVALGIAMLVWAGLGLASAGTSGIAGVFGGSVLLVFGLGFVGGGVYVVVKNLRKQGVL